LAGPALVDHAPHCLGYPGAPHFRHRGPGHVRPNGAAKQSNADRSQENARPVAHGLLPVCPPPRLVPPFRGSRRRLTNASRHQRFPPLVQSDLVEFPAISVPDAGDEFEGHLGRNGTFMQFPRSSNAKPGGTRRRTETADKPVSRVQGTPAMIRTASFSFPNQVTFTLSSSS
jgi:hypothetical protein